MKKPRIRTKKVYNVLTKQYQYVKVNEKEADIKTR